MFQWVMTRVVATVVLAALLLTGCSFLRGTPDADAYFDAPALELARAIEDGDDDTVRHLVDGGADLSATGVEGISLLEWGVKRTNMEAVETLLAAGADPDTPSQRSSPLHAAAELRDENGTRFVVKLLEAGADPDITSLGSRTSPLSQTCLAANPASFEALIRAGATIDQADPNGGTALHTCARTNRGDMALRMLQLGADPTLRASGGTFQDYYFGFDEKALNDTSRQERHAIATWLRDNGHELIPSAARWL